MKLANFKREDGDASDGSDGSDVSSVASWKSSGYYSDEALERLTRNALKRKREEDAAEQ